MSLVSLGSSIAIRVDANTVALGIVSSVHDDGSVDGLLYVAGAEPTVFSGMQVGEAPSSADGSAWSPPEGLT